MSCARLCQQNLLLVLTIAAVVLGIIVGFVLRPLELSDETQRLINFPGEIFMQLLKMMILPLIFASLISALAQMDARESRQMGLITVSYYTVTAILATIVSHGGIYALSARIGFSIRNLIGKKFSIETVVMISIVDLSQILYSDRNWSQNYNKANFETGIVLVLSIHPGDPSVKKEWATSDESSNITSLDTLLDAVRNMFPENIVQATFQRVQTQYITVKRKKFATNETVLVKKKVFMNGTNILGVIVFCTVFGIIISKLGEKAQIIIEFFVILDAIIMKLINKMIWFAPLGITCLIAGNVIELEDLSDTAQVLFMYILTVLCGLFIHSVITMPLLYFLATRKNPLRIMRGMLQPFVTTLGTASGLGHLGLLIFSGATLPISMRCMEEILHVDRRISRFVLPLGSTINMDGNALYEAVAVIFIAQLNNIQLSTAEVITVSVTATVASLGLNSVPAGLVSILLILGTVGLPTKDVSLIITVDWFLDRIRSAINVLGDAYVADVVDHRLRRHLRQGDEKIKFYQKISHEIGMFESNFGSGHSFLYSDLLEQPELQMLMNNKQHSHNVTSFDVVSTSSAVTDQLSWNWRRRLSEITPPRKPSVALGRVVNL